MRVQPGLVIRKPDAVVPHRFSPSVRGARRQLDELGVAYDYVDLVADPAQADAAERISGRKNIPVVVFPDGDHQVEPTNEETAAKLTALGLI